MSYPLSDEDSTDSDSGIRFKTASTRNKLANVPSEKRSANKDRDKYSTRNHSTQSSSRQNSHRSYRDRSRDRYDSRSRRERSRSREYVRDEHRKKVHRNRSPDNSVSSQRRKSEKSSNSRSKREQNSSRSRDNSHDRIHTDKATVKHSRITYKSLSDEDVKKIKKDTKYNSEKTEYRNTSEDDSPVDSPQSSRYTNSPKTTITISGSDDSNNDKCAPIIISPPAQKNKHGKSSRKAAEKSVKSEQCDDTCYGPTLPPVKLNSRCHGNVDTKTAVPLAIKRDRKSLDKLDECYGPSLPSQNSQFNVSDEVHEPENNSIKEINQHYDEDIGPALPPHLQKTKTIENGDVDPDIEPSVDNLKTCNETSNNSKVKQIIGPAIPEHVRVALLEEAEKNTETNQTAEEDQCDSEDDVIGPLPAGYSGKNPSYTQLEERALQMRIDSLNQSDGTGTVREEWMLELPQVRAANLGLGPRQFRAKGVPDMSDRSSWTDTPQDKAKKKVEPPKVDIKKEAELKMIQDRNEEQQKMVEKHKKKKKRDKSLLDAHQEEYNKKKKKEQDAGKSERRPFNRDIDLKANRFDEAQKKSILKKAQLLDSRFSSGESKFL